MIEPHTDPIYGHEQLGEHEYSDEEVNICRENALVYAEYIDRLFAFLTESKSPRVAQWAAAYATSATCCDGVSMSDRASQLRISTQGLSKEIKRYQDQLGLEPSTYMYKK